MGRDKGKKRDSLVSELGAERITVNARRSSHDRPEIAFAEDGASESMRPKLNKWYPLQTRFRVVKAHIKDGEGDLAKQYRLVIEFPREHRSGWFPFELQLRDAGNLRGLTNYWCNPFGEDEIAQVIEAVRSIIIREKQISRLQVIQRKHDNKRFQMRLANRNRGRPKAQPAEDTLGGEARE